MKEDIIDIMIEDLKRFRKKIVTARALSDKVRTVRYLDTIIEETDNYINVLQDATID